MTVKTHINKGQIEKSVAEERNSTYLLCTALPLVL